MKRISISILAICLAVMCLAAGCKKEAAPAPEATAEAPAAEATAEASAPETVVYTEPVNVLRLDSIDYNQEKDEYLLNVTPLTYAFSDAVEAEQEVDMQEGEPKQYPLAKDAVIDFPMLDDLAQTVSLLPGELAEEYNAFVAEFDDKPEFLAEQNGDTVTRLTYFYQP